MHAKSRLLWIAMAAALLLPEIARAQERPIVIHAATLIDGKGGVARNMNIVAVDYKVPLPQERNLSFARPCNLICY